jgi:hypothetical protein
MADTDLEWDERRLCSDDACIGVIGAGNQCNVCGRPGPEGAPYRETPVSIVGEGSLEDDAIDEHLGDGASAESAAFDDDERELCGDDACIGLIGADGRCKECGKPRASVAAATDAT